jgi:uncharacterized protein YegL
MSDITFGVNELAKMWAESTGVFKDAKRFIFGMTPMVACLAEIEKRFDRESNKKQLQEENILLIISDGEPTDGNPIEIARRMQARGIHVACAFITDKDIQAPRNLASSSDPAWSKGAQLMFEMASPVDAAMESLNKKDFPASSMDWHQLLEKSGWTVPSGARLFMQINHSEILADFMRIIATAVPIKQLLGTHLL